MFLGSEKIYPVELQERARLHFPYTTYYHVESVLQKRLKRQDHPLLIVSISIYNSSKELCSGGKTLMQESDHYLTTMICIYLSIYLSSYSAIRPRGHFRQLRADEQC